MKFEHQHDLVYHAKCPDYDDKFIEEVERRLGDHVCDHSGKDHKLNMLKYSYKKHIKMCLSKIFIYLVMVFPERGFKRKISEALFI